MVTTKKKAPAKPVKKSPAKKASAPKAEKVATFDLSSLTIVRDLFKNRADEEVKYVTGVYRYIDPSQ